MLLCKPGDLFGGQGHPEIQLTLLMSILRIVVQLAWLPDVN